MKILELNKNELSTAEAVTYQSPDKLFFNIKHGVIGGENSWVWWCGLNRSDFVPDKPDEVLLLQGNEYTLHKLKQNNNKPVLDKAGNICYTLRINRNTNTKEHVLLLWDLGVHRISNIELAYKGHVEEIGRGAGSVSRAVTYVTPFPILEITGTCEFSWTGLDTSGVEHTQIIQYDMETKNFKIGEVVLTGETYDCDNVIR